MSEVDNFALVPRPPGALEKAAPGAKRILSGMVTDTLALARKARPLRIVMVDDDDLWLELMDEFIQDWFSHVEVVMFTKPPEALTELEQRSPDLLITGVKMPQIDGYKLIERLLARKIKYPILVLTAFSPAKLWVEDYARRGFNVRYHQKPSSDQEIVSLRNSIHEALQIPRGSIEKPAKVAQRLRPVHPLRIVQVNDEPYVLETFNLIIRNWFPNATVLSFGTAVQALEELSQTEPDLLITDDKMADMNGEQLCRQLLHRKVTYPIIVDSPWDLTEQWVRELAGRGLNLFFLPMPFDLESLRKVFEAAGFEKLTQ